MLDEHIVGLAISTTPLSPNLKKPVYLRLVTGMKFPIWVRLKVTHSHPLAQILTEGDESRY
jgi:hypothetical protein